MKFNYFNNLSFNIVDSVMPSKGESLLDAYHKWKTRATNKVCCDYALHVGVISWSDQVYFRRFCLFVYLIFQDPMVDLRFS